MTYYDRILSDERARRRREQWKRDAELAESFAASLFGDDEYDEADVDEDEPYGFDGDAADDDGEYSAFADLLSRIQ